MGQTPAKTFPQPQAIGSVNRPNDILSQSMAAPQLPQNALQPLIQNQIPFVQTANAVPGAPSATPTTGGGQNGANFNTLSPFMPDYTDGAFSMDQISNRKLYRY